MDYQDQKFSVTIPATLEKSEDGEWRVYGLASTPKRDLQGEVIDLKGLDLSPIEKGRGVFNFDHKKGPENTIGAIDKYKRTDEGLYLGGYLFKNHDRAKSLYQIMSSLRKSDRGRMGMSVEGVIKKRDGADGKVISKAVITSCALTMNPINEDTYVDLVKSMSGAEVEFADSTLNESIIPEKSDQSQEVGPTFTTDQVVALLKALAVGDGYATQVPSQRQGGDALAMEDLDAKKRKKKKDEEDKPAKKLKKLSKEMYKSTMDDLLGQLQKLYPGATRSEIWEAVKDRLNRRFIAPESEEK